MTANLILPGIHCPNPNLHPGMQGIERVAVDDAHAQLLVTFFPPPAPPLGPDLVQPASYSLSGGQRLFPQVIRAELWPPSSPPSSAARQVLLTLDGLGDFSIYSLTVGGAESILFSAAASCAFVFPAINHSTVGLRFRLRQRRPTCRSRSITWPRIMPVFARRYWTLSLSGFRIGPSAAKPTSE